MDENEYMLYLQDFNQDAFQNALWLWMTDGFEHVRIDGVTYNPHSPWQYLNAKEELLRRNGVAELFDEGL